MCRLAKSFRGIFRRERANIGETEKPLGIDSMLRPTPEDRKTGSQQHQWKLPLLTLRIAMISAPVLVVEVLDFINEQGHGRFSFLSGFGHGDKEIGQIDFQIAAVGHSLFGLDVQADTHLADSDFECPTKLRSAAKPRFTLSPAPAMRSRS